MNEPAPNPSQARDGGARRGACRRDACRRDARASPCAPLAKHALTAELQQVDHRGLLATAPAMPPAMTKKPPTPPGAFTPEDYNGKKKTGLCCENFSGNENACAASKLGCKWKKKTGKCIIEKGVTKRCTYFPLPPRWTAAG